MEYCSRRGWDKFKLYKDKCSAARPPVPGWIKCCKTYAVDESKQLWFGNWIAWDDH